MSWLKNRRLRKRLTAIGSRIDESYMIYVNNEEPRSFSSYEECIAYLQHYRDNNIIFKLQIYRLETYSL